jgi:hypothetical protein
MTDKNFDMHTICSPSEGELIIVPLVAGMGDADDELYSLNPTGQAIWSRLDGTRTLGQITDELALEYDAPQAVIEQDLLGLMGELVKRRMVIVH